MKIGSQSQTLVSLTSLLDASKQQQVQREEQQQSQKVESSRDGRLATRQTERDELIQQNRDALNQIQDDIRLKSIERLKENGDVENNVALNSRERVATGGEPNQPEFKKIGQIVDLRV